jgi:hypothetical protein
MTCSIPPPPFSNGLLSFCDWAAPVQRPERSSRPSTPRAFTLVLTYASCSCATTNRRASTSLHACGFRTSNSLILTTSRSWCTCLAVDRSFKSLNSLVFGEDTYPLCCSLRIHPSQLNPFCCSLCVSLPSTLVLLISLCVLFPDTSWLTPLKLGFGRFSLRFPWSEDDELSA